MGTVKIRHGYEIVNGEIWYKEEDSDFAMAEMICGLDLDRRRNYMIIDGQVCSEVKWTSACSGCTEGEYGMPERGAGCHECGYQGKVRQGMWHPVEYKDKEVK